MNSRDFGSLRLISGVGAKAPACFLVEAHGRKFLLDLGEGPPPGRLPDLNGIGRVDALILSHGHKDHVGGLQLLERLGSPPVYATESVARALPVTVTTRTLPVAGRTELFGIAVETGRNGHAPGGIWLHFSTNGGLLYTGDFSAESILYHYDPPQQPAAVALLDCSYGDYQMPLAECWNVLAPFVARPPLLLPIPPNGRGPEIALELMRHGIDEIHVDDAMRNALRRLCGNDSSSLRPGLSDEIERLADIVRPIDGARGIMLAGAADGASGASAQLIAQMENVSEVTILFTGYINPNTPAERLTKSGRAQTMRWNVHPLLPDVVTVARTVHANTVVPAFCDRAQLSALARALAPARVTMDGPIEI
jgi:Cft2 family RNA processing exonuclease